MNTGTIPRKKFLRDLAIALAALIIPIGHPRARGIKNKMKTNNPKRALVFWYSQAGHTEQYGRLIAAVWREMGIDTDAADYRDLDPGSLREYDLMAAGSPVYYYEVPENLRLWMKNIPDITGTPVAAYSTFGGEGDNQYNTACTLLDIMAERGGIPAGIDTFGNMSTFAPTWSMGNDARILKYRNLPDTGTHDRVRQFARAVVRKVADNKSISVKKKPSISEILKGGPSIWMTKLFITRHRINSETCIRCGTCARKCPAGAVGLDTRSINTWACIACMGCVNNCPTQAMEMNFAGRRVYGFREFLQRNGIVIQRPRELSKN